MAEDKKVMQTLVIAGILGVAVGWFAATSPLSPIKPERERPVLKLLAKLARTGLWVMMFADPPPKDSTHRIVHSRVDDEGHKVLNHSEGW